MRRKFLYVFLGAAVLMGIPLVGCSEQTPSVPALTVGEGKQFATIQEAVNAAKDGNVIEVYPGTYTEAVCVTLSQESRSPQW